MSSRLMLLWYCFRGRAAPSERERRALGVIGFRRAWGGMAGKRERTRLRLKRGKRPNDAPLSIRKSHRVLLLLLLSLLLFLYLRRAHLIGVRVIVLASVLDGLAVHRERVFSCEEVSLVELPNDDEFWFPQHFSSSSSSSCLLLVSKEKTRCS